MIFKKRKEKLLGVVALARILSTQEAKVRGLQL
jgi:hypothetical protein